MLNKPSFDEEEGIASLVDTDSKPEVTEVSPTGRFLKVTFT